MPGLSFDETKPRSELTKKIGGAVAKAMIPLDQAIMKLKQLYDEMLEEERSILKTWAAQLAPIQRNTVCRMVGSVSVKLCLPGGPDGDIVMDDLPPVTILKAIESWEAGNAYNPGTFPELGWA